MYNLTKWRSKMGNNIKFFELVKVTGICVLSSVLSVDCTIPAPPVAPPILLEGSEEKLIFDLTQRIVSAVTSGKPDFSVVGCFKKSSATQTVDYYKYVLGKAIPLAMTQIDNYKSTLKQEIAIIEGEIETLNKQARELRNIDGKSLSGLGEEEKILRIQELQKENLKKQGAVSQQIIKKNEELKAKTDELNKLNVVDLKTRFRDNAQKHWDGTVYTVLSNLPRSNLPGSTPPKIDRVSLMLGVLRKHLSQLEKLVISTSEDSKGNIRLSLGDLSVEALNSFTEGIKEIESEKDKFVWLYNVGMGEDDSGYYVLPKKDKALKAIRDLMQKSGTASSEQAKPVKGNEIQKRDTTSSEQAKPVEDKEISHALADKVLRSRPKTFDEGIDNRVRSIYSTNKVEYNAWKMEYMYLYGTAEERLKIGKSKDFEKLIPLLKKSAPGIDVDTLLHNDFVLRNNALKKKLSEIPDIAANLQK
jgi:hypothetical protein